MNELNHNRMRFNLFFLNPERPLQAFLQSEVSAENILFWQACERFQKIQPTNLDQVWKTHSNKSTINTNTDTQEPFGLESEGCRFDSQFTDHDWNVCLRGNGSLSAPRAPWLDSGCPGHRVRLLTVAS